MEQTNHMREWSQKLLWCWGVEAFTVLFIILSENEQFENTRVFGNKKLSFCWCCWLVFNAKMRFHCTESVTMKTALFRNFQYVWFSCGLPSSPLFLLEQCFSNFSTLRPTSPRIYFRAHNKLCRQKTTQRTHAIYFQCET